MFKIKVEAKAHRRKTVAPVTRFKSLGGMSRAAKISQTQLAKEMGISQALVSAVLNGHRSGVNPTTYERIWKHALKRGYHPKGMHFAAAPATRAQQVGFILRAPLRLYRYQKLLRPRAARAARGPPGPGLPDRFSRLGRFADAGQAARDFWRGAYAAAPWCCSARWPGLFWNGCAACAPRIVAVSGPLSRSSAIRFWATSRKRSRLRSSSIWSASATAVLAGWGSASLGRHESRLAAFKEALACGGSRASPALHRGHGRG